MPEAHSDDEQNVFSPNQPQMHFSKIQFDADESQIK